MAKPRSDPLVVTTASAKEASQPPTTVRGGSNGRTAAPAVLAVSVTNATKVAATRNARRNMGSVPPAGLARPPECVPSWPALADAKLYCCHATRGRHLEAGCRQVTLLPGSRGVGAGRIAGVTDTFPTLRSVVLDTTDARGLAEFYRSLLGYEYRPGDEPPAPGSPDPGGARLARAGRPGGAGEARVPAGRAARAAHLAGGRRAPATAPRPERRDAGPARGPARAALALGARLLQDRFDDPAEPLYVYADPAGHPFCIFVAPSLP